MYKSPRQRTPSCVVSGTIFVLGAISSMVNFVGSFVLPFSSVLLCLLPEAVLTGTPWRRARTNAPYELRFSLTLGRFFGQNSCRSSRVARTRPLRRPKVFFLGAGTRTSDMLRLVLIFADRLCRPGPVASGRGTRFST